MSSTEQILDTTMESMSVLQQIDAAGRALAPGSVSAEELDRMKEYLANFAREAARFAITMPPPPPLRFSLPDWKERLRRGVLHSLASDSGYISYCGITLADFSGEFPEADTSALPFDELAHTVGAAARIIWYGLDPSYYFERDALEAEEAYQLHRGLQEDTGVVSGTIYTK